MNSYFLAGYTSIITLAQFIISVYGSHRVIETGEASSSTVNIEEFWEIPLNKLEDLPTSPVNDRTKFNENELFSSDEFIEINLNSGDVPANTNKNGQEGNSSSKQFPELHRRLDKMKNEVEAENYCESVYDSEDLEILLHYDENFVRPGGNWWKDACFFSRGRRNVMRPHCTTSPLLKLSSPTAEISTHAFFRSKGIEIPREKGKHAFKTVEFQHLHRTQNPIEKVFLECACRISDRLTLETDNICVDGKIVNLSRGVGGDQSFFVYALDRSSGNFNVVAHIYFP